MIISDRIAVMSRGRVEQLGTPQEIYERPRTHFVADFIGEANVIPARVVRLADGYADVRVGEVQLRAPGREGLVEGASVAMVVRPENILLGPDAARQQVNRLRAVVKSRTYEGPSIRYILELDGATMLKAEVPNRPDYEPLAAGTEIEVGWLPESSAILVDHG